MKCVGLTGFEPATSSSRTMRATICATARIGFQIPELIGNILYLTFDDYLHGSPTTQLSTGAGPRSGHFLE